MITRAAYSEFPPEEHLSRLVRVRKRMEQAEVDALFLTVYDDVTYFSGYRTWPRVIPGRPFALLLKISIMVFPAIV